MKQKLFFITYSLARGGAEKVFSIIANNIDKNIFDVTFIVVKDCEDSFKLNNSVRLICLGENRSIKAFIKIFQIIKKEKPDILFSGIIQMSLMTGIIGYILNTFYKRKILLVMRETSLPSIYINSVSYPRWILIFLIKKIYPLFKVIVAQGENMKYDLIKNFQIKTELIKIINNPIEKIENKINSKTKNVNNSYNLITVGNLTIYKGYDRLLKVIEQLKEKVNFKYWILGAGDQKNEMEKLIKEYQIENFCIFTGSVDNVNDYLVSADLFLQGSYLEGFPNVLIEANQVGLPIVAFDVPGGTNEIIQNGKNGFLVKDGDINEYVNRVQLALSTPFKKEEIINSTQKYSVKIIIEEYETLFTKKWK